MDQELAGMRARLASLQHAFAVQQQLQHLQQQHLLARSSPGRSRIPRSPQRQSQQQAAAASGVGRAAAAAVTGSATDVEPAPMATSGAGRPGAAAAAGGAAAVEVAPAAASYAGRAGAAAGMGRAAAAQAAAAPVASVRSPSPRKQLVQEVVQLEPARRVKQSEKQYQRQGQPQQQPSPVQQQAQQMSKASQQKEHQQQPPQPLPQRQQQQPGSQRGPGKAQNQAPTYGGRLPFSPAGRAAVRQSKAAAAPPPAQEAPSPTGKNLNLPVAQAACSKGPGSAGPGSAAMAEAPAPTPKVDAAATAAAATARAAALEAEAASVKAAAASAGAAAAEAAVQAAAAEAAVQVAAATAAAEEIPVEELGSGGLGADTVHSGGDVAAAAPAAVAAAAAAAGYGEEVVEGVEGLGSKGALCTEADKVADKVGEGHGIVTGGAETASGTVLLDQERLQEWQTQAQEQQQQVQQQLEVGQQERGQERINAHFEQEQAGNQRFSGGITGDALGTTPASGEPRVRGAAAASETIGRNRSASPSRSLRKGLMSLLGIDDTPVRPSRPPSVAASSPSAAAAAAAPPVAVAASPPPAAAVGLSTPAAAAAAATPTVATASAVATPAAAAMATPALSLSFTPYTGTHLTPQCITSSTAADSSARGSLRLPYSTPRVWPGWGAIEGTPPAPTPVAGLVSLNTHPDSTGHDGCAAAIAAAAVASCAPAVPRSSSAMRGSASGAAGDTTRRSTLSGGRVSDDAGDLSVTGEEGQQSGAVTVAAAAGHAGRQGASECSASQVALRSWDNPVYNASPCGSAVQTPRPDAAVGAPWERQATGTREVGGAGLDLGLGLGLRGCIRLSCVGQGVQLQAALP